MIITPGCRPFGVKPDEHVRVTTFSQSIENGADYLVVGRSIRDAPDPRLAAHQVLDEMQKAFDIRENSSTENYSNQ